MELRSIFVLHVTSQKTELRSDLTQRSPSGEDDQKAQTSASTLQGVSGPFFASDLGAGPPRLKIQLNDFLSRVLREPLLIRGNAGRRTELHPPIAMHAASQFCSAVVTRQ
jgi:hypothetical protein